MTEFPTAELQLLGAYTTGMEASWASVPASVKTAAPELANAIDARMQVILDDKAPLEKQWRNAYVCEQLMAQLLPPGSVIAEGDRRLFEAKSLAMKSADNIGLRWDAGKKENPQRIESLRALYATLLDDLQWLYGKRSLDRKTRREIAGPMLRRAIATFALCFVPFLLVVAARAFGFDPLGWIDADDKPVLIGGYLAIAFGSLGALFSRLMSFQQRFASIDYDEAAGVFVGLSLDLRQIVGSIGSPVLFFAIFGELIGGHLFPSIANLFLSGAEEPPGSQLAKLIVWSFIAGFSERLVPDFLTRTESTARAVSPPTK